MALTGSVIQQTVSERPRHPTYNPSAEEVAKIVLWETVAVPTKEREQKIMKQAQEAIFAVGTITLMLMLFIAGVTLLLQVKGEKSQQRIEYMLIWILVFTFACGIGLAIFVAYEKLKSVSRSVELLDGIMDELHREISNAVEVYKRQLRVFLDLRSLNAYVVANEDKAQYRIFERTLGLRLSAVLDDSKPIIKNCYMCFHMMLICYGFAAFATAAGSIATASFVFFTGLKK